MSGEPQPRPHILKYRQQGNTNLSVGNAVPSVSIEPASQTNKQSNVNSCDSCVYLSPTVTKTLVKDHGQWHQPLSRTISGASTDSRDSGIERSQQSSRASLLSERSSRNSREMNSTDVVDRGQYESQTILEVASDSEGSENSSDNEKFPFTSNDLDSSAQVTRRVSVDSKVLSDLMSAALKLREDIQPVPNSVEEDKVVIEVDGPYRSNTWLGSEKTSRRSSNHLSVGRRLSADSRGSVPTHERVQRKRSAQPYFHSLDNPPHAQNDQTKRNISHRSRKTSGCIVCDRKREPTYSAPSVIIKTSVSLKHPMKRRFSEAHRVYRMSDVQLPYMELPILSIQELVIMSMSSNPLSSLTTNRRNEFPQTNREVQLKATVEKELPKFIRYTNWVNILAHLSAKRLVSNDSRQKLMSHHLTDVQKGNYFYMDVLPSQGDDAYCRLYDCLKDEQEHHGHRDLLKVLNGVHQEA